MRFRETHPGAVLREELEARGLSAAALALRLRVAPRVLDLCNKSDLKRALELVESGDARACGDGADAIYKRVTGEDGYFDTRVAYVSETGPANNRTKRIAIMDQDGANNRYITDGATLAIPPRFSPTLQEIVYMAYNADRTPPKVYLQNVDSGRRELLGNFPGMSSAPRFSPDGKYLFFTSTRPGGRGPTWALRLDQPGGELRLANPDALAKRRT